MDQRSQYLAQALQAMAPENQQPLAQPDYSVFSQPARAGAPQKVPGKGGGLFGNLRQAGKNIQGAPARAFGAVTGLPARMGSIGATQALAQRTGMPVKPPIPAQSLAGAIAASPKKSLAGLATGGLLGLGRALAKGR